MKTLKPGNYKGLLALGALLWGVCLPGGAWGQSSTPKYSNEFLRIGVGARAAGMGNSVTAFINDATAGYWNPAGLVQMEKKHELSLMHSEYFAGVAKYDFGAFATSMDGGRKLGVSFIRFGVDDIPNTLNFRDGNTFDYSRITSFSVADMALLLSYAQPLKNIKGLALGGSVKVVNRVAGDFATAWGFGLDLGARYDIGRLNLGLTLQDVTSTFNAWTFNTETFEEAFIAANQAIPQNSVEITLPSARLGVAYNFLKPERKVQLRVAAEARMNTDGPRNVVLNMGRLSVDPSAGLEISYRKLVHLRGGLMNFQYFRDDRNEEYLTFFPTAGLGITFQNVSLDYALSNLNGFDQNLYSHLISFRIFFDQFKL
ncbi:MAG: PorV/PorQ family protein [Bacteroidetes bacterium]|nr:PorV/PorQ family protein [Bacteroidota bacterium]